jgi:hypothetical protein
MMSEILSWMIFVMTVGFLFYWLISYFFLKIGFYFNVGISGMEFFRLWLKPLFILNFSWFLVIEAVFSLVYWTSFVLLKIIPYTTPAILFVNGLHSDDPGIMSWLIISVIIYCVVMIPYFFLQHKLSFYFKRTIFTKIAKSINAKNSRFHGQSARLALNQNVYTQLAARDEKIKEWIKNSIENHQSSPGDEDKRFSIENIATDQMSYEINNISVEFYEAEIKFDGTKKVLDSKGNATYKSTLEKELFDGIVIIVKDMFKESWEPKLFETERIFIGKEKKNRIIHKQSFFIRLFNDIVFKTISTKTTAEYNNSKIEQYNKPEKLKIQTESLFQFIFCDKNDLYLFLKTELDGTSFDLNMNIPVKKSLELFKEDLSLVNSAIDEIQLILKFIEDNNIKYGEQVA